MGAYQAMARLGIAEAQVMAGQFDQAIASFKEVESLKSEDVPVDGVLMQLARVYQSGGEDRGREEDVQARRGRVPAVALRAGRPARGRRRGVNAARENAHRAKNL